MKELKDLKIYIVEYQPEIARVFEKNFNDVPNVSVVCSGLEEFYDEHQNEIDCLVSPANAYGIMTGGFDAAISDILGWGFQGKVQQYIKDNFYGEQPVASSFLIKTDIPELSLIHTPTMRYPSVIKDDLIVYYSMRSTLICALENNVSCIVIPVFGGLCGGVPAEVAAIRMKEAYNQILNKKGYDDQF